MKTCRSAIVQTIVGSITAIAAVGIVRCAVAADLEVTPFSPISTTHESTIALGDFPIEKISLARKGDPDLTFYISRTSKPSPLVLYIQGSGCVPVFISSQDGNLVGSTIFSFVPTAKEGKYAVMVVEKPLAPIAIPANPGSATDCPREFNNYFSYASWSRDLKQALEFALTLPWVDRHRVLLIGTSEGATMASALSRSLPAVSAVALIGATGQGQFFDFVARTYRSSKDDQEALGRLQELESTRDAILADPGNSEKFAWGHTYKRWSGFFSASPTRDLLDSRARVYLVSGMKDDSVPILSTEVMYSELKAAGRRVLLRRIPDAEHNLLPTDSKDWKQLEQELQRIRDWFDEDRY